MKISPRTLQILKVFAGINSNVLLTEGNKIRTYSAAKTVYAEAEVEETFPVNFGIYDLNQFLGVVGLFQEPSVEFEETAATIRAGKNEVRYLPADESALIVPKKAFVPTEPLVQFTLEPTDLNSVIKAAGVLKAPYVSFIGENGFVSLVAHDKTNVNSNNFSVEVAESSIDFEYHVKTEFLTKLLAEKFDVHVLDKNRLLFNGDGKLYMIAADTDSKI